MMNIYVDAKIIESRWDIPTIDLFYPREEGNAKALEIGLCDVRAADSLRITYDFDRDGWSILQASIFEWDIDDETCDADWQEVAFIQAWGRQKVSAMEGPSPSSEER
jgi:hypothetical protein